jgi:prepilin-type N-terminal cleavage/methylation domain-containing protein/prepilin-type processing-associated H-X9-DG protein
MKLVNRWMNSNRRAFTLIELLVVIAIIAVLAAILFPVFAVARAKARQVACLSNTKQIGTALIMYAQDYDDTLVPNDNYPLGTLYWFDMLQPYIKNDDVFTCPDYAKGNYGLFSPQRRQSTYVVNNLYYYSPSLGQLFEHTSMAPLSSVEDTAGTVFSGDGGVKDFANVYAPQVTLPIAIHANDDPPTISSNQGWFVARHNGGLNTAFLDGHSKWFKVQELTKTNAAGNYPYFTKIAD